MNKSDQDRVKTGYHNLHGGFRVWSQSDYSYLVAQIGYAETSFRELLLGNHNSGLPHRFRSVAHTRSSRLIRNPVALRLLADAFSIIIRIHSLYIITIFKKF